MKKVALALFVVCLFLTGSAFAQVLCDQPMTACQFFDKDPNTPGWEPAIQFAMGEADTVHVIAGIWGAFDCKGDPDAVAEGDVMEPAKAGRVRIRFMGGLPDGTPISMKWLLGTCPPTDCINYLISVDPPACAGAADDYSAMSVDLSVGK